MYEMKRNMIKYKKGSRKTIRTTLAAGKRGQLVIQESNRKHAVGTLLKLKELMKSGLT